MFVSPFARRWAWGIDEADVQAHSALPWFGMGLTIVDSLDTLLILKLDEEFAEARQWIANHLDFERDNIVSVSHDLLPGPSWVLRWKRKGSSTASFTLW